MKEKYYTAENIHRKADEFLAEIESKKLNRKRIDLDIKQAGLLVLDMQKYFLREGLHAFVPSAPAIVPGITSLIELFHRHAQPVVFTRHVNSDHDAGMMKLWWQDLILEENPDSQIIFKVDFPTVKILLKSRYDAFDRTQLEEFLHNAGVKQLVITGVMTHLCCESTARAAFMRDFQVFFTVDGTATYNSSFHQASLLNLSHGFAELVRVADVLEQFRD